MTEQPPDTDLPNVPRPAQQGTHTDPMPLDPDRRLMRITGLDRDPEPALNSLNDAGLLDLLGRAADVRARRRASGDLDSSVVPLDANLPEAAEPNYCIDAGDLTGASEPARPMGAP